jgi:hypothetical protein
MVADTFEFEAQNLGDLFGLDRPIWHDHSPLVLGWSDPQLADIATVLKPVLGRVTQGVLLTAASIARTLVTEHLTTGRGIYYSRSHDFYEPSRYRDDPRLSYYLVRGAVDALRKAGLVDHAMGIWIPRSKGRRSTMWVTMALLDLVAPLINLDEPRELRCSETVILRDRDDKSNVEYDETADTAAMRDQLGSLNNHLVSRTVNSFH